MELLHYAAEIHGAQISGFVNRKDLPVEKKIVIDFPETGETPMFVRFRIERKTMTLLENREATQAEIDEAE